MTTKKQKTVNIHDLVKDVTLMRMASTYAQPFGFTYKDADIQTVIMDVNSIAKEEDYGWKLIAPKGKIEYLDVSQERLDRVLYILSCLIKKI
jgi:hypothetical protein